MLRKPNKVDYTTFKSYHVISFLNFLGKVCERVVADILSEWCEVSYILHEGKMDSRRQRNTIDAIAREVDRVQKACMEGKIAGMLLIDVKEAFDHVSRN